MNIQIIRATQTWQQAGAYYVRIQAMAKQYDITLRREFDEHDTPNTEYIVLTDDDFPVATCRFYELDSSSAMIGRVVVLPEYRGKGANALIFDDLIRWFQRYHFDWAVTGPQMESNEGVLSQWQYLEAREVRRHRCYRKKI